MLAKKVAIEDNVRDVIGDESFHVEFVPTFASYDIHGPNKIDRR